ncbi:exosortase family protein XrtF [Flavobacteriaceae bacterium Ap0902]|nr:exosortase family protein XrtF [Flavobacteriaceae bacterium Ap0902]
MLKEFKPILFFIAKFFGVYILLTILYSLYLQPYLHELEVADPITNWMTDQAVWLAEAFGFKAHSVQIEGEVWRRFILEDKYVARVNEGCNAVSVMIIFVSFIIAFSRGFARTTLYILGGLAIMVLSNIARIFLLTWIFRFHPSYSQMSHDYLFPAIIYGTVVILWLVWVKFFAFKKE